jgi:hypothetical protein
MATQPRYKVERQHFLPIVMQFVDDELVRARAVEWQEVEEQHRELASFQVRAPDLVVESGEERLGVWHLFAPPAVAVALARFRPVEEQLVAAVPTAAVLAMQGDPAPKIIVFRRQLDGDGAGRERVIERLQHVDNVAGGGFDAGEERHVGGPRCTIYC